MSRMDSHHRNMRRLSLWGMWLAFISLSLLLGVTIYMAITLISGNPDLSQEMIRYFDGDDLKGTLNLTQTLIIYALWMVPDALAFAMLFTAWRLFRGFRQDGVLVPQSARRLRNIGWCIFAVGPMRILSHSIGSGYLAYINTPSMGRIHLSLEDMDLYAVIIGLIIVASGHIIVQAIEISEENRSFV